MTKQELQLFADKSHNISDFSRRLGYTYINGRILRKVATLISEYCINVDHFVKHVNFQKRQYTLVVKVCPACNTTFEIKRYPNNKRPEQVVCSNGCANTWFRSGLNNPNFKNGGGTWRYYTKTCFENWDEICAIPDCCWSISLDVHHVDRNRKNNDPTNLLPLCPNHHRLTRLSKINVHRQNIDMQIAKLMCDKFAVQIPSA